MSQWWIDQFSIHAPGLWLLLSLTITLAFSVWFEQTRPAWAQRAWVAHRLLIPYLGLLLGGLSPRLMGLTNFDWSVSLSLGAGLIFVVVALLIAVRATVELPSPHQSRTQESAPLRRAGAEHARRFRPSTWRRVLLVIAASGVEQFHWAFLRGGIWEMILTLPEPPALPAYWAIWLAAALVVLESALLRPALLQWLLLLTILVTTSILFFYTHNFWLCWALHSAAALILGSYSQVQPLASTSTSASGLHR